MQQIDKQDTQTTYGQEHDDPKHNVTECAVSPAFNAAPPLLPGYIISGSGGRVKVKLPSEETIKILREVL